VDGGIDPLGLVGLSAGCRVSKKKNNVVKRLDIVWGRVKHI
jgi:hypothetical protein